MSKNASLRGEAQPQVTIEEIDNLGLLSEQIAALTAALAVLADDDACLCTVATEAAERAERLRRRIRRLTEGEA